MIKLVLPFFFFSVASLSFAEAQIKWPENKSAVAWSTKKRMFLFKNLEPVGINSDIQIEDLTAGKNRVIRVSIPIDKFNSGESMRDKEVFKILKGDVEPNLEFKTQEVTKAQVDDISSGKLSSVDGTLKIGGEIFPVKFSVSVSGAAASQVVDGSILTTFTRFKIEPPSVAGGLVTKVADELNLYFHFLAKDMKGL